MGGAFGGGSGGALWARSELSLNGSGALPLTLPRPSYRFDAVRDSGTLRPPVQSDREEAAARPSAGGGATVRGPKHTAHNKIPPRWLNCPRRASRWQVTGTGVFESAHGRVRGWA